MNKLESLIYNILDNHPYPKKIIRDIYQRIFSLIPSRNIIANKIDIRPNYFYGFHDKCPWSFDNTMLLTHKILDAKMLRMPRVGDKVEVGYFSGDDFLHYNPIATTSAWNWQQGSMLQWVGSSNVVAFNDYDGSSNHGLVIDLDNNEKIFIERPISASSPDGTKALSYTFERKKIGMPGYEYAGGFEGELNRKIPAKDGLYIIDLKSRKVSILFSIKDIVDYHYQPSFKNAFHFFSHCLFSPSSKKFVFFHRWLQSNNYLNTRMISSDLDGNIISILPTDGMVSHIGWLDDDHIVAYASTKEFGRNYYLFNDSDETFSVIGNNLFSCDGHPQISADKRWMITDTYPDRYRRQFLKLYDMRDNRLFDLLRLKIPFKFRDEMRCDFHPRWNHDFNTISFDSAHMGVRSHCTMKISLG